MGLARRSKHDGSSGDGGICRRFFRQVIILKNQLAAKLNTLNTMRADFFEHCSRSTKSHSLTSGLVSLIMPIVLVALPTYAVVRLLRAVAGFIFATPSCSSPTHEWTSRLWRLKMARIKVKLRHICQVEKQRRTPSGKLAGNAKKGTVSREQERLVRSQSTLDSHDIWEMARSRD